MPALRSISQGRLDAIVPRLPKIGAPAAPRHRIGTKAMFGGINPVSRDASRRTSVLMMTLCSISRRALVLHVVLAALAQAQATRTIRGTVSDSAGRPIPRAEISTTGSHGDVIAARSDDRGAFALPGVPNGPARVAVRAVGYQPVEVTTEVRRGENASVNIVLSRITDLDTVRVSARPPECEERTTLTGFNCRRLQGAGIFIDQLEIARRKPVFLADIFWDTPGFKVDPVVRHRRAFHSTDGWGCINFLQNGRLPFGRVEPKDILAIEVYRTYADIPQIYRVFAWAEPPLPATTCAIVNFWLKGSAPR
jgi:hypothetical protein